jgi:hypothetical protein
MAIVCAWRLRSQCLLGRDANLGYQTVYRLFNADPDIVCERFFLPPKQELAAMSAAGAPLLTLESQTPVGEFDVVAFSVSFEWDYVNVLTLLRLAGIPRYAAERTERHPLIVVGGAVTFVNPEPLAPFADAIAAGEGEVLVPGLRRAFSAAGDRAELLRLLARERSCHRSTSCNAADGRWPVTRSSGLRRLLRASAKLVGRPRRKRQTRSIRP